MRDSFCRASMACCSSFSVKERMLRYIPDSTRPLISSSRFRRSSSCWSKWRINQVHSRLRSVDRREQTPVSNQIHRKLSKVLLRSICRKRSLAWLPNLMVLLFLSAVYSLLSTFFLPKPPGNVILGLFSGGILEDNRRVVKFDELAH